MNETFLTAKLSFASNSSVRWWLLVFHVICFTRRHILQASLARSPADICIARTVSRSLLTITDFERTFHQPHVVPQDDERSPILEIERVGRNLFCCRLSNACRRAIRTFETRCLIIDQPWGPCLRSWKRKEKWWLFRQGVLACHLIGTSGLQVAWLLAFVADALRSRLGWAVARKMTLFATIVALLDSTLSAVT